MGGRAEKETSRLTGRDETVNGSRDSGSVIMLQRRARVISKMFAELPNYFHQVECLMAPCDARSTMRCQKHPLEEKNQVENQNDGQGDGETGLRSGNNRSSKQIIRQLRVLLKSNKK